MKISITGSRSITNYQLFLEQVSKVLIDKKIDTIISGGASGIDSLAKKYCEDNKINLIEILPEWEKFGKSAGIIRNKEIIESSDFNIIIWDGKSKGSNFNINYCKKNNKTFEVVLINEQL